jgi:hypothetical protein
MPELMQVLDRAAHAHAIVGKHLSDGLAQFFVDTDIGNAAAIQFRDHFHRGRLQQHGTIKTPEGDGVLPGRTEIKENVVFARPQHFGNAVQKQFIDPFGDARLG